MLYGVDRTNGMYGAQARRPTDYRAFNDNSSFWNMYNWFVRLFLGGRCLVMNLLFVEFYRISLLHSLVIQMANQIFRTRQRQTRT